VHARAVLAELAALRKEASSLRTQNAELLVENSRMRGAALSAAQHQQQRQLRGRRASEGGGGEALAILSPTSPVAEPLACGVWLDEAVARQMESLLADKMALAAEAR
jgi:hypothetical protein